MKKLILYLLLFSYYFGYAQIELGDGPSKIIGKTFKIGKLEISQKDYAYRDMDWDEAKYACQSLGKGWRLPTLKEMNMIYKIRYKIKGVDTETLGGTFGEVPYWTSNEDVNDLIYAWYKVFVFPGYELTAKKEFKKHVRAVRTMK